jgi:hypothetical protein
MVRHFCFAIAFIATGILLTLSAEAGTALRCEDHAVNCGARCTDPAGGAGDVRGHPNNCIQSCARQVSRCLGNAFIHSNAYVGR